LQEELEQEDGLSLPRGARHNTELTQLAALNRAALFSSNWSKTILGPSTPFAEQLHAEKYRTQGETFREAMNRIAAALDRQHELTSRNSATSCLISAFFRPGACKPPSARQDARRPITVSYRRPSQTRSLTGEDSIMDCASQAATTMRMGGGIGYDFSTLRPRNDLIKKLQSRSSGPISFMEIFDAVGTRDQFGRHRRGAQMGVLAR
jgi:ribonucleoside-diphosphate reductase alpha chain